MKNCFRFLFVPLFAITTQFAPAQENESNKIIEAILEAQLENLDEETDVSLVVEDLEELLENPLNLNVAGTAELKRLFVLNDVQIEKILQYIREFGPVYSIYELNSIDGFTPEILTKISPFIWFGPVESQPEKLRDEVAHARQQALFRVQEIPQKAKGFKEKEDGTIPFEGNSFRGFARYKFEAGERISAGITAEKDPGEAFFKSSNKNGFDFYSGHLSLKINKHFQNLTVGDFIIRSGQGLVLWQGYSNGKSVYTMDISKTGQGVRPYTSADENLFFRGTSATFSFGSSTFVLFYSQKKTDANLETNTDSGTFFTSLQTSGYHRTQSEIEDEKSIRHTSSGMLFNYRFLNLKLGITVLTDWFNLPFLPGDQLYNRFRFTGKENYSGGINYMYNKGKYQLFGEIAASKSGGKAFLNGAVGRLNDQLSVSVLVRNFGKNYQTLWGNAFAEGSSVSNESGIYFGTTILPLKRVTISAYSDFYRSEWINFTTAAPAKGWDNLIQANVVFSEKFEFYLRFKHEEKEQKYSVNEKWVNLFETNTKTRFHFQYKPTEVLTLKTRFEHTGFQGLEKENGFLVFQDIQVSPEKIPVAFSARVAWFSTDSYNSRIYAWENDLLYTFSIPPYYGRGFREYVNLKWKISDRIDFWMKAAHTTWNDRQILGSGNSEIDGNNKTELKFQLRLKI